MITDEGSQNELDSIAISFGILSDAFERIDATDPDVNILAAELVKWPA